VLLCRNHADYAFSNIAQGFVDAGLSALAGRLEGVKNIL
jgi:hypothetical protein